MQKDRKATAKLADDQATDLEGDQSCGAAISKPKPHQPIIAGRWNYLVHPAKMFDSSKVLRRIPRNFQLRFWCSNGDVIYCCLSESESLQGD
jgi:hypothetical protein